MICLYSISHYEYFSAGLQCKYTSKQSIIFFKKNPVLTIITKIMKAANKESILKE